MKTTAQRKILIIDAHPAADSFGRALADSYAAGATAGGHQVQRLDLRDLDFDLNFPGYGRGDRQPIPDIERAQIALRESEHIVWGFPVWWGTYPALLKGFLDRTLMPGFAFRGISQYKYERLLAGRSARLLATMDSPTWYHLLQGRPGVRALRDHTLRFCGIDPVRVSSFGSVKFSSAGDRERWLGQAQKLGARAA